MKYENANKAAELVIQIKAIERQLDYLGRLSMRCVLDSFTPPEAVAEQLREPWKQHVETEIAAKKAELEQL